MTGSGGINVITQSISGYGMSQELPAGMIETNDITYTGDIVFEGDVTMGGIVFSTSAPFERIAAIPFGATELTGSEVNTSFAFPDNGAIALGAWIKVTDGESGTIDVGTQGTSNDPDGLLDGISVTSTGTIIPTATITTGLAGTYISATTFGALTTLIDLGTDDDGDSGFIIPRGVFITGGDPVSITSSGDLNSCSGILYIRYIELPA